MRWLVFRFTIQYICLNCLLSALYCILTPFCCFLYHLASYKFREPEHTFRQIKQASWHHALQSNQSPDSGRLRSCWSVSFISRWNECSSIKTVVNDEIYYWYQLKTGRITFVRHDFNSFNRICPWEVSFRIPFQSSSTSGHSWIFLCHVLKRVFIPQICLPSPVYSYY
jgi:hypothetical protein